jgi:hypothetical protein
MVTIFGAKSGLNTLSQISHVAHGLLDHGPWWQCQFMFFKVSLIAWMIAGLILTIPSITQGGCFFPKELDERTKYCKNHFYLQSKSMASWNTLQA